MFVCDGRLDVGAKPGSSTRVKLRDPLVLDGVTIAAAGTPARLVVGGVTTAGGTRRALVSVDDFRTAYGIVPVRASGPLAAIVPGADVPATTQARVVHLGNRIAIEVPFPYALSGDAPVSVYTPVPAATAPARLRPTPRPAPQPTKSPQG